MPTGIGYPKGKSMEIARDKLRTALRSLGDEYILYMLDEAIDLLPSAELGKLAARYLNVNQLRSDWPGRRSLLAEVRGLAPLVCDAPAVTASSTRRACVVDTRSRCGAHGW